MAGLTPPRTWPPALADLKADLGIDPLNTDQDTNLTSDLLSAIGYVQRVRPLNYDGDITDCRPGPTDDLWGGTIAYARRLFTRRRSPDGMVSMQDLGVGRVPLTDADIDRLLGIGRFQGPVTA